MKALIVYDSKHGNTKKVAKGICAGMRNVGAEVAWKDAKTAATEDFQKADVWVLGSPTRWGGASRTMKGAMKRSGSGAGHKVVLFDTRLANSNKGAVEQLRSIVTGSGAQVVSSTYFTVKGMNGPLMDGEEGMAKVFGQNIAQQI